MDRTAVTPPLKCFGLEQQAGNPQCARCLYRADCAAHLGNLTWRVDVSAAQFALVPAALAQRYPTLDIHSHDPDLASLEEVYAFCHQWVFGHKARGKIGQNRDLLLAHVRESGSSLKLYFLANMLGWKESHATQAFPAKALAGSFAVRQVRTFAAACHKTYGTFDTTSLDRLMGSHVADQDFETLLLHSEIVAGSWIIGYKQRQSGDLCRNLYREKELQLNPYWLAVEPSYYTEVLESHLDCPDSHLAAEIHKHRWDTVHVLGQLKRQARKAVLVFRARQEIMPDAVQRVLGLFGFQAHDFQMERQTITNPIKFWAWLGIAIQHYRLYRAERDA